MNYSDTIQILVEKRVADGYGGFEVTETTVATLKCRVAPYRVQSGDVYKVPNPTASVKIFVPGLPFDEDTVFIVVYKGKRHRKLAVSNLGKVSMIIAERI